MASPMAKKRCCRSSSRRNRTGSMSDALTGDAGACDRGLELRQAVRVMRRKLRHAQGDSAKRQAVRRQHQRIRRQRRECRRSSRGSAPADRRPARRATTLTLVLMRGSSMSPEIRTPRSAECSDACSGECPCPQTTCHGAPPAITPSPSIIRRSRPARPARRAGSGCRAPPAPRRNSARHAVRSEQRARVRQANASRAARAPHARSGIRTASSSTGQPKRCREPCGVAQVVGMIMRRDDARDRPPFQRRRKMRLPQRARDACRHSRSRRASSRRLPSSSHRLMWSSANGSGIRIQSMPGATSRASPGAGGAANGYSSGGGMGRVHRARREANLYGIVTAAIHRLPVRDSRCRHSSADAMPASARKPQACPNASRRTRSPNLRTNSR